MPQRNQREELSIVLLRANNMSLTSYSPSENGILNDVRINENVLIKLHILLDPHPPPQGEALDLPEVKMRPL